MRDKFIKDKQISMGIDIASFREQDLRIATHMTKDGKQNYFKIGKGGNPSLIYCMWEESYIRIVLDGTDDKKIKHLNDPKTAGNYVVRTNIESWKLPSNIAKPVARGSLVRIPTKENEMPTSEQPTIDYGALGVPGGTMNTTQLVYGESTIDIGEGGVQISHRGQPVLTISGNGTVNTAPSIDMTTFGENQHGPFKDNLLAGVIPRAFIPGFNIPNWLPNMSFFFRINGMAAEAAALNRVIGDLYNAFRA